MRAKSSKQRCPALCLTFVTLHLMLIVKFHPPDIFSDIQFQQISSPTLLGTNRSSSPRVQSHDASSESRRPTMQPSEATRRKSAGKSIS